MNLTILSDIHEDIDKYYEKQGYGPAHDFSALKDQEFVIICGDISGNTLNVKHWVNENISRGVFCEGNHLGYEKSGQYQIDFKQGAQRWLSSQFDGSKGIKYIENDIHIVDDIVFVGCTLYTDFNLYNKTKCPRRQKDYMNIVQSGLNDFRHVMCENNGNLERVTADKYLEWHNESIAYIEKICQEYPDKKIVVISHHAPSKKSIAPQYQYGMESRYNAGYASNLEWLIKKYKNIRLFCHGHCHNNSSYRIAQCKVICWPFGYHNQLDKKMDKFGNRKNCLGYIIDTEKL